MRPIVHIKAVKTGMFGPKIAVDANRNLYAANGGNYNITVCAAGDSGDVKPVRTIGGPATHLDKPTGIAVDGSGRIYISYAEIGTPKFSGLRTGQRAAGARARRSRSRRRPAST